MNSPIDLSRARDRQEAAQDRQNAAMRAVIPTGEVTPAQVLALAVQQGADLQTLEKFMALQERWEANQARKAFDAAISAAKAELKPIVKTQEVDFTNREGKRTNYMHEDFAQIALQVDPVLAKYGLSYRHRSKQEAKKLTITCVLSHRDGHSEDTSLTADNDESGNKNSIQSIGSTATYLQRYTLKLALGLAAAKDTDGRITDSGEPRISEEQAADLKALITEHGGNQGRLMQYFKIKSLDEILAKNYDWCVAEVKRLASDRAAANAAKAKP